MSYADKPFSLYLAFRCLSRLLVLTLFWRAAISVKDLPQSGSPATEARQRTEGIDAVSTTFFNLSCDRQLVSAETIIIISNSS